MKQNKTEELNIEKWWTWRERESHYYALDLMVEAARERPYYTIILCLDLMVEAREKSLFHDILLCFGLAGGSDGK
jgi:hypothetical protein